MLGGISSAGRSWAQAPKPTAPVAGGGAPNPAVLGMQQSLNAAQGWYGPQLIQNDIASHNLAAQLGYADAGFDLNSQFARQNNALAQQRLGLDQANIGVDRDAINRQMGVNDQLQQLANQLFGLDREGLDSKVRAQGRGFIRQEQAERSESTVKGSMGSVQNRRDMATIGADRNDAWGQYLRDATGLGVKQQESDIGFKENKAKLGDRLKTLDTEAAKLGIDRKRLQADLEQGLAKLGLDRMMSYTDLLDAMASTDIEKQAIAQSIFRDAMMMAPTFTQNLALNMSPPKGVPVDSFGNPDYQAATSKRSDKAPSLAMSRPRLRIQG